MGTKTQKQRKCCYHNLNAKQLIAFLHITFVGENISYSKKEERL